MKKIGIICEYNPFHNGHLYHINEIKKKYPDSIIILVLNGYFLQRGEISLISKYDKCKVALNNNVDIVLELPVLYGTQSADTFAYTSIDILNKLGVESIIFGSESNDINYLTNLAKLSLDKHNDENIKKMLDTGCNYPTALSKVLNVDKELPSNDLLGISYIKAILQINNQIIPETIQRTNDYLDTESNDNIVSASNIREKIKNNVDIDKYIPKDTKRYIKQIDDNLYFNLLKSIVLNNNHLDEILDVDEGIENRLKEIILKVNNITDLVESIKTKRYTYNKVRRMLVHILLNIKKEDAKYPLDYIHILGFSKKGKDYLNKNKIHYTVNKKSIVYNYELKASIIYDMLTNSTEYKNELSNKPIITK